MPKREDTVVITGASTGIGAASAALLVERGYRVFGSVRRDEDEAALRERGATPIRMDVTDLESIQRAAAAVADSLDGEGLVGLVNNAGVPGGGPLELLPLSELRRVLEVNTIGVLAVTQAFLPLLRRAGGRIVNVSSVSGRVAMPFMGPYAASKFALEALSDCLRRELAQAGIRVIVLEPGPVETPIWEKAASLDTGHYAESEYGPPLERLLRQATAEGGRLPVETIASAVLDALTRRRPPTRVLLVPGSRLMARLARLLPDRWLDGIVARRLRT
ncbi:MAG: SDR family oxidoreductase [Gemmatimonadota bacterium]